MDRNQAKEFYHILQAFAEGKVIECRTKPSVVIGTGVPNEWTEMKEIEFWNNTEYRIKPEVKFRPFANTEECWKEILKHKPLGWVKDRDDNKFLIKVAYSDGGIYISEKGTYSFDEVLKKYIFADDTPFGIKEEK